MESNYDEPGWADASTSTLPPDDTDVSIPTELLSPIPNSYELNDSLDDTTDGMPSMIDEASRDTPLSQQETQPPELSQGSETSEGASVSASQRPPRKRNNQTKKVATRSKGTQVDMKLIGSSWPRVKKNPSSGEAGPSSTGTRRAKKKSGNQQCPEPSTSEGSQENLCEENTAPFSSEENLSSSLTGEPGPSLIECVENEQNLPIPFSHGHRLSVILEETSDLERSPLNRSQLQPEINKTDQSVVPQAPSISTAAAAPGPVIANFVINISHSGLVPTDTSQYHTPGESTIPINIRIPSITHAGINQESIADFNSVVATSSHYDSVHYSSSSDRPSSSTELDRSVSYESLIDKMPPKTSNGCSGDECGKPEQKPTSSRKAKTNPKAKDKKQKPKTSTKKLKKKSKSSQNSRRCCCSESDSYSDYSCSSYDSCSCSDCCDSNSDYTSDSSDCKAATKKKKSTATATRRKTAIRK